MWHHNPEQWIFVPQLHCCKNITFHKNTATKIRQLVKNHFFLYITQAGKGGVVCRDASECVS
jgi:hypothetical protein